MTHAKLIACVAALASSCTVMACAAPSAPPPKTSKVSREQIISDLSAQIVRLSAPYDVTVTDVRTNSSVTVICGLIRSPGKRPHTFISLLPIDYQSAQDPSHSRIPMIMPMFGAEGSWEIENNSKTSDEVVKQCRGTGVPIERPPA
jgi:hypothetical protein